MRLGFLALTLIGLSSAPAPAQEPIPYGPPITLEQALKLVAAAEAEARKHSWPVAITVVDSGGHLVAFHRLDNTQLGSIEVSLEKARTSAMFRRPTKYFEDAIAAGGAGLRSLRSPAMPIEGGLPVILEGKIIGGIGVSGVKPIEDGQVARAGLAALEPARP